MSDKTITILVPLIAPFGFEVDNPGMVEDVWNAFVKPLQSDDAPPQSAEMLVLMAILRAVHAGLEAADDQA